MGDHDNNTLLSALVQCFGVILIGYLTGKYRKLSTTEVSGLNNFVQCYSLPALIFSSLVKLDFDHVNWTFMASIFVSKTIVFILVAITTLIVTKPADTSKAGLYAILATQSNDFALGYPLILALYSHHHPEYAHYIYLLAPIQLAILNPVGFFLIEIHKQETRRKNILYLVLKGTMTNPVIIMTVLGIISNIIFHEHLPNVLCKLLDIFGSAYSATALFLLGISLVGKFGQMKGRALICPIVLILAKILLLPLIIQKVIILLSDYIPGKEINELSNFGFLYGTFPFAPAAYLYAVHYGLSTDVVSTGMVICTVIAAPFMAISASVMSMHQKDLTLLKADLLPTKMYSSIITLTLCIWLIISFLIRKKWKIITHRATFIILLAEIILAVEGITSSVYSDHQMFYFKLLYIGGVSFVRIWTVILALTIAFLHWRSLCFVIRLNMFLNVLGVLLPISVVATMAFIATNQTDDDIFEYGIIERYIILIITSISVAITTVCLIIQQRRLNQQANYQPINDVENTTNANVSCINQDQQEIPRCYGTMEDIEDIFNQTNVEVGNYNLLCADRYGCSSEQRKACNSFIQGYADVTANDVEIRMFDNCIDIHDISNHFVLLFLLNVSMIISLAICTWMLVMETSSGILIELQFLDILLVYGQGIIIFLIFELDVNFIIHLCARIYRKVRYGSDDIVLPDIQDLEQSTQNICQQFIAYHQERCEAYLQAENMQTTRSTELLFSGKQLINYLTIFGLAQAREEAEHYGQQLLLGRVVEHVNRKYNFHDNRCIYKFVNRV
ncbi:lysosomal cholesterol signaling protein-like isoform X1 [Centruroides vittatus]|uniref:lysosomal cholesterol signaling protein-like isoform X1 n=1 Tax=Centruroides vittatus TaxID=120091 RepID=UPI0035107D1C